jgi:O-antigen ligase
MSKKKILFSSILLCLLVFLIPIEHKYDKLFRHFSLTLIPPDLSVPSSYDPKIYFYISDLLSLLFLGVSLLWFRIPLQRFFLERGTLFLWMIFLCAFCSIAASPFAHYPIPYIRLLQLLSPILLFSFLAHCLSSEERTQITHRIFITLLIVALLQSGLAIAQYAHQGSFGLRLIGEQKFMGHPILYPSFHMADGTRWIFDRFSSSPSRTPYIARVFGTLPHPNVLGGLLTLSILSTYALIFQTRRYKWLIAAAIPILFFAMNLTYSRSALFAWAFGTCIWFGMNRKSLRNPRIYFLIGTLVVSVATTAILIYPQITSRGGVFNYNTGAKQSDNVRLIYQRMALQMVKDHPLLGVGYTQFSVASPPYFPSNVNPALSNSGTHNIYLFLASETGLFSLAAFLLFLGYLALSILRMPPTPHLASLTAIFFAFLFIGFCDFYPILFQQGKMLFFLTAGLLAAHVTVRPGNHFVKIYRT